MQDLSVLGTFAHWSGKIQGQLRSRSRSCHNRVKLRIRLEPLEDRLAPAGLVNGDFAVSNPSDVNYGWSTQGNASIVSGVGVLDEGTMVQTEFSQTVTIAPGTTALRFTFVASNLVGNGT